MSRKEAGCSQTLWSGSWMSAGAFFLCLQVTPLAVGVSSFAAATFDRWIYVIGGGPNGKLATDQVQRWEPGKDCWEMRAPIPVETKCTSAVTFNGCIYVVGRRVSAGVHLS